MLRKPWKRASRHSKGDLRSYAFFSRSRYPFLPPLPPLPLSLCKESFETTLSSLGLTTRLSLLSLLPLSLCKESCKATLSSLGLTIRLSRLSSPTLPLPVCLCPTHPREAHNGSEAQDTEKRQAVRARQANPRPEQAPSLTRLRPLPFRC